MKVCIIGWYGTETIGDRAILSGLISMFNKAYDKIEIRLGSLYTFFSNRTITEDSLFWKQICDKEILINLFNSKDQRQLRHAIKWADMLVMGGGPLMDLDAMFMIEYGFKYAKKINKKTAVLGCGIGPLFNKKHIQSTISIIKNSDLTILRDCQSVNNLKTFFKEIETLESRVFSSVDPALEACVQFVKNNNSEDSGVEYIAANFRSFPKEYSKNNYKLRIDEKIMSLLNELLNKFNCNILLTPMHYFQMGHDDREYLNYLQLSIKSERILVQDKKLSLVDTMRVFKNAEFNVGMRYHSVVFQTILNGKNLIVDYTEPKKGKVYGFINEFDLFDCYKHRYVNLQEDLNEFKIDLNIDRQCTVDLEEINKSLSVYREKLECL